MAQKANLPAYYLKQNLQQDVFRCTFIAEFRLNVYLVDLQQNRTGEGLTIQMQTQKGDFLGIENNPLIW